MSKPQKPTKHPKTSTKTPSQTPQSLPKTNPLPPPRPGREGFLFQRSLLIPGGGQTAPSIDIEKAINRYLYLTTPMSGTVIGKTWARNRCEPLRLEKRCINTFDAISRALSARAPKHDPRALPHKFNAIPPQDITHTHTHLSFIAVLPRSILCSM